MTWNGCGRPSSRNAIASPSSTNDAAGSDEHGGHDLRQPRGHVVQRAREDPHRVAGAVDLDPRPVELPLDRGRPGLLQRGVHVRRRRGQHRRDRPPDLEPERRQRLRAALAQRGRRRPRPGPRAASAPAARPRPAPTAALATASPTIAASAPCRRSPSISARRKACSDAVARASSAPSAARRAATDPAPLSADNASSAASTSATVSDGDGRRRRRLLHRRPAHPEHALARRTREVARARRALVDVQPAQRRRQPRDLVLAARQGTDVLGGGGELGEQHAGYSRGRAGRPHDPGHRRLDRHRSHDRALPRGQRRDGARRGPRHDGRSRPGHHARSGSTSRTPTTSRSCTRTTSTASSTTPGSRSPDRSSSCRSDELRHQLEVNVIAQLAVTQACFPALTRNQGRIVNVSSIAGRVALPLYGPYAASKFALEALSDSLRREQQRRRGRARRARRDRDPDLEARDRRRRRALERDAAARPRALRRARRHASARRPRSRPRRATRRRPSPASSPPRSPRRHPRTRYVVGRDARIQALLGRALPGAGRIDKLFARLLNN